MSSKEIFYDESLIFKNIIDTHTHFLILKNKGYDIDEIISFAFKFGFLHFLDIGIDSQDFFKRAELLKDYENVYLTAGIHPLSKDNLFLTNSILDLEKILKNNRDLIFAVGEIGLDFYRTKSIEERKMQLTSFKIQLSLAKQFKLPIIIHARDTYDEILEVLKEEHFNLGGILHCFSSNYEIAKKYVDLGFKISFSGNLTYKKNNDIREAANRLPLQDIFIETDSPYLTPQPIRGRDNLPIYLGYTLLEMEEIKRIDKELIIETQMKEFKKLFLKR